MRKTSPSLLQVMDFWCKIDDIHNRHTSISLDHTLVTQQGAGIAGTHPLTMSERGDAMNIYALESRQPRGGFTGASGRWRDWGSGRRDGRSNRSTTNANIDKDRKDTSKPSPLRPSNGRGRAWAEGPSSRRGELGQRDQTTEEGELGQKDASTATAQTM